MTVETVELVEGDLVELTVGAPAHGGHCVARLGGEHGRVVFVRHALPGEKVTAEITELHKSWVRADAITVHEASADRVEPPCPWSGPGKCGGCDLQHVAPAAQLDWKTEVVHNLLTRMAGLSEIQIKDLGVRVEPLPGGPLGWRSRVRYAVDAADRPGLLKHRSHEVVPVDRCRIAHPGIQALDITTRTWPEASSIETVASTGGDVVVIPRATVGSAGDLLDEVNSAPEAGSVEVRELAAGREWHVPADGFWQIHPSAADTLVGAVLELLDPQPGETSWDLYGGAGLFAAALNGRTGARTTVVESSPIGVVAARRNLADLVGTEVIAAKVEVALARRRPAGPVDLIVLDPPRTGAGAKVVRAMVDASPRAIAYVACDPAALARDLKTFAGLGWKVAQLRAYDCFPMTQHVECVALVVPQ
ncbi:class I SAM-dependent RNA methyltransferase [Winogradskya humida]|uniref:RNA methyltransferase n=1 Tax=Winogradskya humida TaxID=113566 RepID=A0ABQ3ZU59_9ACTN|nr:TRAM domain-containing protein [Actinoplanes humidus]GIE21697.1 putative RNA methyltransferase [Actinoplanes humidus]